MILTVTAVLALGLAIALIAKPQLGLTQGGRAFGFAALFVAPVIAALLGLQDHVERSKRTEFCTSCHVMELHGRSLRVDDDTLLAATHFQGGRIPRATACFSCHTTYSMYGDIEAKLGGLKHLWVNYLGTPPEETKIKTYKPYHNRECLHCHDGARRFEQGKSHRLDPERMGKIKRNELSCMSSSCHEFVHDVANIGDQPLWSPK